MLSKHLKLSNFLYATLLCLLAWSLGKLFVSFLETPQPIVQPERTPLKTDFSSSNAQPSGLPSYIFGRPERLSSQEVVESPEMIQKSSLNLKLIGLLLHPIKSIAVIEIQGKAQVFAVGETIQRDVELIEVGADFAIISNRGKQEKLELKPVPNVLMAPGGATDSIDMTQALSKKLALIKKQVKQTPISILGYVRFEFVNSKGKPVMIKVWPKKEAALFNALGFESGDLLKVVNGHTVEALSKNPALWQALMSESSFSVVVDRQGVEQNLRVELP